MQSKLNMAVAEINDLVSKFRLSEALKEIYRLFWDDFSAWYLEMVKPAYGSPIDSKTLEATIGYFDSLLRLLHPFMPFITEELWQHISQRRAGESIMYAPTPEAGPVDDEIIALIQHAQEVVNGVRNVRAVKNIPNKEPLTVNILGSWDKAQDSVICKLANVSTVNHNAEKDPAAATFIVGVTEVNVPLADTIDKEAELQKLRKDLAYYEGFKASVLRKLSNERFVNNAPANVVEAERKKLEDADAKIRNLNSAITALC